MRMFALCGVLWLLGGCGEPVIEKPDNLIPKGQMVNILYDLAIINAAKSTNPGILEEHGVESMPYIYEKYGIDSVQFVRSDIYYASRPADYEAIYRNVELRLDREKQRLEQQRTRENDSIRKTSREQGKEPGFRVKEKDGDSLP